MRLRKSPKYITRVPRGASSLKAAVVGGVVGSLMTAMLGGLILAPAVAGMAVFDATNFAKNAAQEALSRENLALMTSLTDAVGEVSPAIMSSGLFTQSGGSALEGLTETMSGYEALSGLMELASPFVEEQMGGSLAGGVVSPDQATQLFRSVFSAAATGEGVDAPATLMLQRSAENIVKRVWTMQGANQDRAKTMQSLLRLAGVAAKAIDTGGSLRGQEAVTSAISLNQTQAIMELHQTMLQIGEMMAMQTQRELNEQRKPGAKGGWSNPDAPSAPAGSGDWVNPDAQQANASPSGGEWQNPDVFGEQ